VFIAPNKDIELLLQKDCGDGSPAHRLARTVPVIGSAIPRASRHKLLRSAPVRHNRPGS
jgi:hypothetical protein